MAAGVAAALLGAASTVVLWPDATAPGPAVQALAPADDATRDAAANALRAAAAFRAQERISRGGAGEVRPAIPSDPAPAVESPAPVPTTPGRAATKTAATKPAAPVVPDVVGRLWVTAEVNVRSGPSVEDDRIGRLEVGARARVTGVEDGGWTQVVLEGRAGWVRSGYLSTTKPAPKPERVPGVSAAPCKISPGIEPRLTANAQALYRAVCAAHGGAVSSFGGYRPGDDGDHGSGRALDIMVSGEPGWTIARYVQARARALDVEYVIYQQRIWLAGDPLGRWKTMPDRGGRTANHYDHVHVSVS